MTKDEYLAYRKQWGRDYQDLAEAIKEAKMDVRRRNSYWAQVPTPLCQLNLATARTNLATLRKGMREHQSALWKIKTGHKKVVAALYKKVQKEIVAGPLRERKPIDGEVMAALEKYRPIGLVLKRVDGVLQGLVEHSFAMDWDSKRICLFWSGKAYSMLGEHTLDGMKDAEYNAKGDGQFVFDALSPECPVDIDWPSWLEVLHDGKGDKFFKRNALFTEKV